MAYDEELAKRIRELVVAESDLTEQRMFGGLAFLVGGNMAVAASGQGGLIVRVDPAESDTLVATTHARPMEMRGRPMRGWLRIDSEHVRTRRQLARWVKLGTTYARTLPPSGRRLTAPERWAGREPGRQGRLALPSAARVPIPGSVVRSEAYR